VEIPDTRFATTADGVSIAFQVVGRGTLDIVLVLSAFVSNMEIAWEWSVLRELFLALSDRGRLIMFDRRGAGLSDGVSGVRLPTLEARMEDIRAVMDAAGSDRAVLYSMEDGAAQCFLFAATYPERTQAVVGVGAASRGLWAPDAPWLWTEQQWAEELEKIEKGWGTAEFIEEFGAPIFPDHDGDSEFFRGYGKVVRHSLSKSGALAAERMYRDTDVRDILPLIQAPTLVMHFTEDQIESVQEGRFIAQHIPGAVLAEIPGADHSPLGDPAVLDRFLASLRAEEEAFDRVLATVLFTDIAGSTELAAKLGDKKWKELVERHHSTVRALLGRYRGHEVDTAGDGFFATFDGPARAIRCARAVADAVRPLGLEVKSGLHTGEVETINDKIGGIAVNIGARVAALAEPSQVLVSQTVKDLVAGSGLIFEDAGEHELRGVPDSWRLYRVL
jgi:class 3 adenylate cyclase